MRTIPLVAVSVCTNPPLPIHFCFLNADVGASGCVLPRVAQSISAFEEELGFHIILQKGMTKELINISTLNCFRVNQSPLVVNSRGYKVINCSSNCVCWEFLVVRNELNVLEIVDCCIHFLHSHGDTAVGGSPLNIFSNIISIFHFKYMFVDMDTDMATGGIP